MCPAHLPLSTAPPPAPRPAPGLRRRRRRLCCRRAAPATPPSLRVTRRCRRQRLPRRRRRRRRRPPIQMWAVGRLAPRDAAAGPRETAAAAASHGTCLGVRAHQNPSLCFPRRLVTQHRRPCESRLPAGAAEERSLLPGAPWQPHTYTHSRLGSALFRPTGIDASGLFDVHLPHLHPVHGAEGQVQEPQAVRRRARPHLQSIKLAELASV